MNNYIDIIIKVPKADKQKVLTWLKNHGVDLNKGENGVSLTKGHRMLGRVCSGIKKSVPTQADPTVYLLINIRVRESIASKVPDHAYVAWRSDVLVEREVEQFHYIHHKPVYDDDGKLIENKGREKVSDGMAMVETTAELPTYAVYTDETQTTTREQTMTVIS